jgi:hypothetical protein
MQRIPHSTGLNNNIEEVNLVDIELDAGSNEGAGYPSFTYYSINAIITTDNSKTIELYNNTSLPISTGQYIVVSLASQTLNGIPHTAITGLRKVLNVSGFDNNLLTIEADTTATSSGTIPNSSFGSSDKFRIKPILSTMSDNTVRFYVLDLGAGDKYLRFRYRENGIDYNGDVGGITF